MSLLCENEGVIWFLMINEILVLKYIEKWYLIKCGVMIISWVNIVVYKYIF